MAMSKCVDIRTGEKYMLTIKEASVYFGIGIKQLRRMVSSLSFLQCLESFRHW